MIRIVTPGTVTESSMLDESKNNYMASLFGMDGGLWSVLLRPVHRRVVMPP